MVSVAGHVLTYKRGPCTTCIRDVALLLMVGGFQFDYAYMSNFTKEENRVEGLQLLNL